MFAGDDVIPITLTVYDTHELRMELLSYDPAVKILAPPYSTGCGRSTAGQRQEGNDDVARILKVRATSR